MRENSVVPLGLEVLPKLSPGLPSWAKLDRPCGAGCELRHGDNENDG